MKSTPDRNPMEHDVIKYEKILNESDAIFEQVQENLKRLNAQLEAFETLKDYYISEAYRQDVTLSNMTNAYDHIPCGVLSEDAVFNSIGTAYQLALEMLETATKILKKH